jgi:type VI secretion system secreted protein Hcp
MAADYLLVIEGIQGESKDAKHPNAIEIDSWSLGGSHPGSARMGSGDATGKVEMGDIHFTKPVDKATPNIFRYLTNGKHLSKAVLYCRKATGDGGQLEYLTITMNDVMISSWQHGGSSGGGHLPTDSFSLDYAKIEYEYKPQRPDGGLDSSSPVKYDVKTHQTT